MANGEKDTCGTCGHYVRLVGAAHSHRCDISMGVVWPDKAACHKLSPAGKTARLRVHPVSRKGAEAQRRAAR